MTKKEYKTALENNEKVSFADAVWFDEEATDEMKLHLLRLVQAEFGGEEKRIEILMSKRSLKTS